jgi:hypothetical protein
MMGFIYISDNDFANAKMYADKCLTLNPENIFAKYISARLAVPTNY